MGAGEAGAKATDMLEIGRPDLDWVALAGAQGVPGARVRTLDALGTELKAALGERGPRLVEVML